MNLRQRVAAVPPSEQDGVLARYGPTAAGAELVDLVVSPVEPVGAFVPRRLESLLVTRGPTVVDDIASAMLSIPLARSTRRLAAALGEIGRRDPPGRAEVSRVVTEVLGRALDLGAGTWEVGELLGWYLEAGDDGRSRPEAARIAQRVLDLGASEADPYLLALERARVLLGRLPPDVGPPPESPQP